MTPLEKRSKKLLEALDPVMDPVTDIRRKKRRGSRFDSSSLLVFSSRSKRTIVSTIIFHPKYQRQFDVSFRTLYRLVSLDPI